MHLSPRVLVPLFLASLGVAQTNVGGLVTTNTTWTAAGSPYQVTATVLVTGNATLTIQPGVVVNFTSTGQALTIGSSVFGPGTLLARGTAAQPVRFTSVAATPGSWRGLLFSTDTVDASYDSAGNYLAGSIMEHCVVEFAGRDNVVAIDLDASSPHLVDSVIRNNLASGIVANGAPSLRVTRCQMHGNRQFGLSVTSGSNHVFTSCSAVGNGRAGFALSSVTGLTMSGIESATNDAGIDINGCTNITLQSIVAVRNIQSGLVMNNCAPASVVDAVIRNNRRGLQFTTGFSSAAVTISRAHVSGHVDSGVWTNTSTPLVLTDSSVCDNASASAGGGVLSVGRVTLSRCVIAGNSAPRGGGVYCGNGVVTATETAIVCNSAVTGGGGIFIQAGSLTLAGNATQNQFNTIQGNTVAAGGLGADLYNNLTFSTGGGGTIPATHVCWGSRPSRDPNRIYDFFSDPSKGIVNDTNPATCGSWQSLLDGAPGIGGVPALSVSGTYASPGTITLQLSSAAPSTAAVLALGFAIDYAELPGFNLVLGTGLPPGALFALATNGSGGSSLQLPIPGGLPSDLKLVFQALVADATAANGILSMSNALLGIM